MLHSEVLSWSTYPLRGQRDSIQIIGVKTLLFCIILALILYVLYHTTLHFISVLIHSLNLILRHLILITFYALTGTLYPSAFHPFKNTYKFPNNHNRVMYKSYKFDLASPSIDHSIKFSDSL